MTLPTPEQIACVDAAITSRRSLRAFLPTPVPQETVEAILTVAARAPSGTNTQPWRVTVLTGDAKARLSAAIRAAHDDPEERARHTEEYAYYPTEWVSPYVDRRRKVGWDLYSLLGIGKADKERMHAQHGRNYDFFDAPVGLVFSIERVMRQGSWLDYGMFLQNIMVAARARGLDTCPQAAFTQWHRIIRAQLQWPDSEMLVCGMALGYADMAAPENQLVTERAPVASFTRFVRMKPAVLVARAVYPETLARLQQHFEVEANPEDEVWSPSALSARLAGKLGALTTGSERIDAAVLAAHPQLRVVANMAVGYNNLDIAAFDAAGVLATNTPDVLTETTADFGFALMMATARRITESEHYLRAGRWTKWRYDMFTGPDVHGATLGILGMGRIGQAIARRGALGFGMKVIYTNRSRLAPELEAPLGARYVDKATLLREADHLVLVLPYSASSHHAIGAAELAQMKPTATLTNVARGGIVDDAALAAALAERRIAAAGLDVFEGEPAVHPALLDLPNVVLTPHIASASERTRRAMADLAADNLIAALTGGAPPTPVNPGVLLRRV